ncbi:MAG: T9SS type A sorting domain-containing protein, partial [Bacteroidota bacterium]
MKSILQLCGILVAVAAMGPAFGQNQNEEDSKIVIEITKEINGEKKTFKGEYNSTEEMNADPNYREFADENDRFSFWSDHDGDFQAFFDTDRMKDMQQHFFRFFDGNDEDNTFFFHNFDDDSSSSFQFNFDTSKFSEDLQEKMKDLGVDFDSLSSRFQNGNFRDRYKVIVFKRIEVADVGDEFGKKGMVSENNRLALDDLTFYPNPSQNGKIKLRFTTPEEGELSLQVINLEGKEVFKRYFNSFSGLYSETIDLSGQQEGIYLLEIAQGKKRITKKL